LESATLHIPTIAKSLPHVADGRFRGETRAELQAAPAYHHLKRGSQAAQRYRGRKNNKDGSEE
jgi:hypothetical protein